MKKPNELPIFYPPSDQYEPVLRLCIDGQPARKSNGRRIVTNKRTQKPMSIKSEEALDYSDSFLKQVPGEAKVGLGGPGDPLFLMAEIFYKSNRSDISVELVKDLLQEAGVVFNDRYIKGEVLFGRVDKNYPRTVITLYRLRI